MKKVIIEIDGREQEYNTLTEGAKVLGVSVATISQCAACGYKCKGHNVRYSDGTRRARKRSTTEVATKTTANDVVKMIARWYTKKWKGYISSDALVSLTRYIKEHWNWMPETNEIYMQYREYIDTVFRIELKRRRDAGFFVSHEDEEDLHQTIIQKVLKYIPRHDPNKSSIKTYLYTIVKTQLKWQMIWMYGMEGRQSKESWHRSLARLDDQWDAPAGRTIDDVIEGMEEPMREAVLLLLDGASHEQVRQHLGMAEEEWESMLDEIRDYLKECQ